MSWKNEEYKLAKSIVYLTGRVIADIASAQGKRLPLSWVEDVFFKGLLDGFERNDVPRTLVADLLGLSPRTLRRRINAIAEQEEAGFNLWTAIHEVCLEKALSREEILQHFSWVSPIQLITILNDMLATKWIKCHEGRYSALEFSENISDDALDGWLILYSSERFTPSRIQELARYMNVSHDRIEQAIERIGKSPKSIGHDNLSSHSITDGLLMIHTIMTRVLLRQKTHGASLGFINLEHLDEVTCAEVVDKIRRASARLHEILRPYETHDITQDTHGEHIYWAFLWGRGQAPSNHER